MEENRKVALITGAARGIGKEIAIELAKNACDVSINSVSYTHLTLPTKRLV